ncbi:Mediator of RNA polymerase II transcription subunit 16 [Diplodia seriata]|uniref:Mediator of RNA polymerase II transcription subunit 16 n=1 Tax=Diplodia seriata TaxID=420778 RepID=A0ABR3CK83_9PEZI
MPLIMDDDQYMDLFNEAEQLPIAVQTPPVKRLAQRLDELGESGCCQKISWSKSGCVASITRDGRGVNLRAFQRNPVDGKWILGDEAPLHIPSVHEEFPLVHVSWGHLGVDLAVVDAAGRILVYTAAQAADRMKLSREPFSDHESESNALVGLHWLPVAPQQVKVRDRRRDVPEIPRGELDQSSNDDRS